MKFCVSVCIRYEVDLVGLLLFLVVVCVNVVFFCVDGVLLIIGWWIVFVNVRYRLKGIRLDVYFILIYGFLLRK